MVVITVYRGLAV